MGKNYFEHKIFLKEKKAYGFYFQKKKFGFQTVHDFEEKEILILKFCSHSKDFLHHILEKKVSNVVKVNIFCFLKEEGFFFFKI